MCMDQKTNNYNNIERLKTKVILRLPKYRKGSIAISTPNLQNFTTIYTRNQLWKFFPQVPHFLEELARIVLDVKVLPCFY